MIGKILVPTDGSENASKAINYAFDLAGKYDATIYLLHVVQESKIPEGFEDFLKAEKIEKPEVQAYMEKIGQRIIEIGQEQAKFKGVENVKTAVLLGDPTEKILQSADANEIDMIIMGSRGLGEIKSLFLGSVSSKVCNQADCTCVTVK
jgi:nucleotide-binding universal stress UspA family protein